uniref:Ionotropic receptor 75u n=1 Tax=Microplitis mediator TaxID=375433 RepID=A0A0H4KP08_9HYME|nr:ionotropic receptor 75u [Microplitis mediator]
MFSAPTKWLILQDIRYDNDSNSSKNYNDQENKLKMFSAPTKWLILQDIRYDNDSNSSKNNDDQENRLKDKLKDFEIFPDSELFISQRFDDDKIKILSIYRPSFYVDLIIEEQATWDINNGINFFDSIPTSRRRRNLQLTPLKTCLVLTNPDTLNHLTDYKDKRIDAVTKANYIWMMHLVNQMNATVTYTWRDTWGYPDKNGTWSGMIGLLDRGEIDFGGTATFLIKQRIGVIEYLQLYTPVGSKFVFRKPPLSYVSNLFTLPFGHTVWYAIGVMSCIVLGFLYITMKWEWKEIEKSPGEQDELKSNPTISDNLLILLSAISQQGLSYEPRTISSRIVTFMLLIAALSLYASYTANIVALLQSTSSSINTLKELINSGLKLGIYDIVYNRYYFGVLDDPIRREFRERFVTNKTSIWITLEDGIEKVRQGLFAFHVDTAAGYQLMQETYEEEEKCGLQEIDYMGVLDPMLVIKKKSPYREIFRVGSLWLRETGLQQRDTPRLFTKKPVCVGHTSFISVGTTECYAAFYTITYGAAIAFGFFFLEIILYKCFGNKMTDDEESTECDADIEINTTEISRQSSESLEATLE